MDAIIDHNATRDIYPARPRPTGQGSTIDCCYQRPSFNLRAEDRGVGGAILLRLRVGLHVLVFDHHAHHRSSFDNASLQCVYPARGETVMMPRACPWKSWRARLVVPCCQSALPAVSL